MKEFNIAFAIVTLIIVVLGLFYKKLKQFIINETLMSTLIGIALSPLVFNVLNMTDWGRQEVIMELACRLTLAMALMATAFRIKKTYLPNNKRNQTVFLLLIMPAMFLSSSAVIYFLTDLDWLMSLLIGAVVTPTDPVLAGTIITGEKAEEILPVKLRDTISFESGANDGLAFPFVMLMILLIQEPEHAWSEWFTKTILWETMGAIAIAVVIGYLLGKVLAFCIRKNFTGKPAFLAFSLSVAFFVLAALELVNVNSILAVFITGLALKRNLSKRADIEEVQIQEMMSRLFTIPIFLFFGLILPWKEWSMLGWITLLIPLFILLFRRLPYVLLARPLFKGFSSKDIAFVGWFGPIGVAALFYSFYTYKELHDDRIWHVTSLIVFSSVIAHGVTAYPLLKKYKAMS